MIVNTVGTLPPKYIPFLLNVNHFSLWFVSGPGHVYREPVDALVIPDVLLILSYINMSEERTLLLKDKSHTYRRATQAEIVNRKILI